MIDSPIHEILNDIRKHYSGKECSIIDIRKIEDQYRLCSIVNTRNGNCAFLRINSFGRDQIVFEDIVLDYSSFHIDTNDIHAFIFEISKGLYELAYGVILKDANETLIEHLPKPAFDFYTLEDQIDLLKSKCNELELKVSKLQMDKTGQMSIFNEEDQNN